LSGWVIRRGYDSGSGLTIRRFGGTIYGMLLLYYEMHTVHLPQQPHDPIPLLIDP